MQTKVIMDHDHPKWAEFIERLEGPEGCDFKENEEDGKITWRCRGGYDKTYAKFILETYPDIDVERTLKFFEDHGGHCDCEIIWNVAD